MILRAASRLSPRALRRAFRGTGAWYVFVLPPLLLVMLFVFYPTLRSFRDSLYDAHGPDERFVGAAQFGRLALSPIFWSAIGNTILLGVAFLALVIPLAVILASLLNRLRRGGAALKVIYFLPQLTSSVAVALMFNYVFQPDWGLLNGLLHLVGIDRAPLWLADPRLSPTGSRAAVTILAVWAGLGYYMLVALAGLQAIPVDLYDAAALDGASPLQTWWHITLPGLRPTLIFLLMTGMLDALSRFGDLWTLAGPGGAPARSLQTIILFMFQTGFEDGDMHLAAAIGVLFFFLVLAVTVLSFRALLAREFGRQGVAR